MTFIFVPLLIGFFEFARVMQAGQVVTTAARYGVRSAILSGSTETDVTTDVKQFVSSTMNLPNNKITVAYQITPAPGNPTVTKIDNAQAKDMIQISVTVNYDDISLVTGNFMKGKSITSAAAMRHE